MAHLVLYWTSAVKHSQDPDPKARPQSDKLNRCSVDMKRKSYQSEMRKFPESCSVSLKPSTQRETCSDQSTAGFAVSDAFRLLDQKENIQKSMKTALQGIVFTQRGGGSLRRIRVLQNVASNPGRLASHVLDNNTNSAPIIRRTFSVSVVSSPSQSANAQTECANVVHVAKLFQKDLTGTTKRQRTTLWLSLKLPSSPIHRQILT